MPEAPQDIWAVIRQEVQEEADREPLLSRFLHETILKHESLVDALGFHLSHKLSNSILSPAMLQEIMEEAFRNLPIMECVVSMDIRAIHDRDPACRHYYEPLLFYKGFHSLESYRVAHWLWNEGRKSLAYFLQNRISEVFAVDIHPAARIGTGILIDHATSIVIGETAVVEDNVSLLHDVTLGGTGKEQGDRHPKVRHGVLIGAGAKILGNVEIGEGAKIGAGSVVLMNIPPHCTAVGVPAVVVGKAEVAEPALAMDHSLKDVPPCPKNSQCLLRS